MLHSFSPSLSFFQQPDRLAYLDTSQVPKSSQTNTRLSISDVERIDTLHRITPRPARQSGIYTDGCYCLKLHAPGRLSGGGRLLADGESASVQAFPSLTVVGIDFTFFNRLHPCPPSL